MKRKHYTFLFWLIPAVIVWAIGFAVAARYDLAIDQAINNTLNPIAISMEAYGAHVVFLPAVVLLGLLGFGAHRSVHILVRIGSVVCYLGGTSYMFYHGYEKLVHRGALSGSIDVKTIVLILLWVALFYGIAYVCRRISHNPRLYRKVLFWAICGTVLLVANQVIINGAKLVWQRTRFDDMQALGSFDKFTPWYRPLGNGGSSFPSGHTANAVSILLPVLFCDLSEKWKPYKSLFYIFGWAYIAFMGYTRMQIGRHFLSDVLAGAGIMALVFWFLHSSSFYKKWLALVLAGNKRKKELFYEI